MATGSLLVWVALVEVGLVAVTTGEADPGTLQAWCFNPPGDDCGWYRACLAARYGCEADNNSYALGFGEAMCNKFTQQRNSFSETGQHWIDRARACLQRKLVPVLAYNQSKTCPEIKKFAFHTHVECYSERIQDKASFCDLPLFDWLKVTWIIKGVILRETGETLTQATQIIGRCASRGGLLSVLG